MKKFVVMTAGMLFVPVLLMTTAIGATNGNVAAGQQQGKSREQQVRKPQGKDTVTEYRARREKKRKKVKEEMEKRKAQQAGSKKQDKQTAQ